jgi:hypothetical protein
MNKLHNNLLHIILEYLTNSSKDLLLYSQISKVWREAVFTSKLWLQIETVIFASDSFCQIRQKLLDQNFYVTSRIKLLFSRMYRTYAFDVKEYVLHQQKQSSSGGEIIMNSRQVAIAFRECSGLIKTATKRHLEWLEMVAIILNYVSPLCSCLKLLYFANFIPLCALAVCNYYAEVRQSSSLYTASYILLYYILIILFLGLTFFIAQNILTSIQSQQEYWKFDFIEVPIITLDLLVLSLIFLTMGFHIRHLYGSFEGFEVVYYLFEFSHQELTSTMIDSSFSRQQILQWFQQQYWYLPAVPSMILNSVTILFFTISYYLIGAPEVVFAEGNHTRMFTMTIFAVIAIFCVLFPIYLIAFQTLYRWSYPDADISLLEIWIAWSIFLVPAGMTMVYRWIDTLKFYQQVEQEKLYLGHALFRGQSFSIVMTIVVLIIALISLQPRWRSLPSSPLSLFALFLACICFNDCVHFSMILSAKINLDRH